MDDTLQEGVAEADGTTLPPSAPVSAKDWNQRIQKRQKDLQKWHEQIKNVDRLYSKDERADSADREYSIFWANIEVLKPATYARPPVPVVAPRFKDHKPIARDACEVLERCLVTMVERSDLDNLMREVRDDYLMYSRGTAWARLAEQDGAPAVVFEHLPPFDFLHSEGRSWLETWWVARCAWMTEEEGKQRFGEIFDEIELKKVDKDDRQETKELKAQVWEIWDKRSGLVTWVCDSCEYVLDQQPPHLSLSKFWPCPKPAFGTLVPRTLKPVPDIRQYKDQMEEINEYTARIAQVSQALRMKGFYISGAGDISEAVERALKATDQNAILVPIPASVAGMASLKDVVVWLPVADCVMLVKELVALRRVLIEDVYQITGISDILRGSTQASETATAQQIKSQWGSMRVKERQQEMQRYACDLIRIAAEIMCENFPVATLAQMAQADIPTMEMKQKAQVAAQTAQQQQQPVPPQLKDVLEKSSWEEIQQLLASDLARGFTIEIETDSTIQPDEDAEKQRRTEFVTAVGGLFQQAAPLIMQAPQLGPFMGEVLKFAAGGFRAGRPLEGAIDHLVEMLDGMAQQASQPKPPDPEMQAKAIESQTKAEVAKMTGQVEMIKAQTAQQQAGVDTQLANIKLAIAQIDLQIKQLDLQKAQVDHEAAEAKAGMVEPKPDDETPQHEAQEVMA